MIEFPKRFSSGYKLYGWVNPNHNPSCRYLNTKGKEVSVSHVTRQDTTTDPDMVGVGEVVWCTVDIHGLPRHIPVEVQEWIKAAQQEEKDQANFAQFSSLPKGDLYNIVASPSVPIQETIAAFKKAMAAQALCTMAYYGTGECSCGNCRIFKSDTRNDSFGYRPGEIK
jgi:hypothetical protein